MADEFALQLRRVSKRWPGVLALSEVDLDVLTGEIHALVGENGAGKSTLIGILAGVSQPDSGEMRLFGDSVRFHNRIDAQAQGIGVVFQELSLCENLSIAENLMPNRQPCGRLSMVNYKALRDEASRWLNLFGWQPDPMTPVYALSPARKQVVEILKALSMSPRVLILDEPNSSLSAIEDDALFRLMRRLRDEGTTILWITHHLPDVLSHADRVTVLRDGRRVVTQPVAEVTEGDLARSMVGRPVSDVYGRSGAPIGTPRLRVEGLTASGKFAGVTFTVCSGEIVGLAGLAGSGRTEVARALCAAAPADSGVVQVDGQYVHPKDPSEAIGFGIAYMTEDRKRDGLFLDLSVQANMVAASLDRHTRPGGWLDDASIARVAQAARDRYRVVCHDLAQPVGSLSGGNQQKALLAMWAGVQPRVLIVDEPTRGVDVGAKAEIYQHLRDMAAAGVAILLISSDLPEVIGLSDRVLVMRKGRLVAELQGDQLTEDHAVTHMTGAGLCEDEPEPPGSGRV